MWPLVRNSMYYTVCYILGVLLLNRHLFNLPPRKYASSTQFPHIYSYVWNSRQSIHILLQMSHFCRCLRVYSRLRVDYQKLFRLHFGTEEEYFPALMRPLSNAQGNLKKERACIVSKHWDRYESLNVSGCQYLHQHWKEHPYELPESGL